MNTIIKLLRAFFRALLGYPSKDAGPDEFDDMHPDITNQREVYAMDKLDTEIKFLSAECKISRREALCKLLEMNGVNCKERSEVEKFFWGKGVSAENITTLTDEFYHLQNKKFKGD